MGLMRYYLGRMARNRAAMLGLAYILAMAMVAVLASPFAQDPNAVDFRAKNLPPPGFASSQVIYEAGVGLQAVELQGRWEHPLGTDDKGRDMLAMLLSGSRVSLLVGLVATGIAIILGTLIGVTSAYFGGRVDNALMRFTDVVMTFPLFLLLVFIVFIFGSNLAFITIIIGLTGWTATARLVRSEALSLRTREFLLAAKVLGASDARIIARHL
ncbi:MAG: ABC transporter permease, partial [Candidatus Hydrothermarchaeota archaeon]